MKKRPTMQDVAKLAGVSAMAVSYALRGHPSISKRTATRIRKAAKELNYTVNPLISAYVRDILHGRETKAPPTIAFLVDRRQSIPAEADAFRRMRYEGAKARCRELGFGFSLVETAPLERSGKHLNDILLYNDYCGLIISMKETDHCLPDLDWSQFPSVMLGSSFQEFAVHRVDINHFAAMKLAFERLEELGYRRIGLAIVDPLSRYSVHFYRFAFETYLRQIEPSRRIPPLVTSSARLSIKKLRHWIKRYQPDVLIDAGRWKYQRLLEAAGFRIPKDIAYAVTHWSPKFGDIAGINQHSFELGAAAVDVLARHIYGRDTTIPRHRSVTLLDADWVDNASAPPRHERLR